MEHTREEPVDPLTDTGKYYNLMKRAARDAFQEVRQEERKTSGRTIAQAVWHGITVAKAEIWEAMGWK